LKLALLLAVVATARAAVTTSIEPALTTLSTPESRQQLLLRARAGATQEDWTRNAEWKSSNAAIAEVSKEGVVTPKADGVVEIAATANGVSASTKVTVQGLKQPFAWGFRHHVIPVLTKTGCNQGACHGALAGKNGFKLTLRGYDPELDYDTLTRQSVGRRVSLADPAASLLLRKAIFETPHGGGKRFDKKSLEYRVVNEWIANGAPPPTDKDAEVTGLEVYPAQAILKPNAEQQLVVRAKYSNGRVEDVTRWVKFSSSDEGVAQVDDATGRVKMVGHGESAITLWYASKVLYARVSVPFAHPATDLSQFTKSNFIDGHVMAKWRALNLTPSKPADDSTFIRRAYLDAAGVLPTAEEVEKFLADQTPGKRAKLIDALLERDEYVDYWSYKWSDLMLVSSRKLRPAAMFSLYNWIRDSVRQNQPWDQFARDIFTGSGSSREKGALNYFVLHKDPIDLTETTTQAFLGQRLTCARCHNHPLEKWTQKQYYQMASLFARVGQKQGNDPAETLIFAKPNGEVLHPRLLRPMEPTPLDGVSLPLDSTEDRRAHFAKWLTDPKNPYFAANLVNRVWANFMGRGLKDPMDDLRATNPASNEELFAALTQDFVQHKFDVKHLIRTIMNSSAYQLSSDANATNQNDNKYYSKFVMRRLSAEVLLDAMSQVTGVPTAFPGAPAGTRALQLPDVRVASEFLDVFGRPKRIICDAGERTSDPSISQALHVINGDTLNKKLASSEGNAALLVKLGLSENKVLDHLMLSALARPPRESERADLIAALNQARAGKSTPEARKQAVEDLFWAVLTSKEFLFNY
jgi:hypothetical protein